MLDHFAECIKQAKGVRQQAVQLNIFTAVLSALKVKQSVEGKGMKLESRVAELSRERESSRVPESRMMNIRIGASERVKLESRVLETQVKKVREARESSWFRRDSEARELSYGTTSENRFELESETRVEEVNQTTSVKLSVWLEIRMSTGLCL